MSISQNFPDEGPTLNLNFTGSKVLDPRITFSRSSSSGDATYMNGNGLIVTAAADEPRFDHRYVNGEIESLGLLVEEQRVNYCVNSTGSSNWSNPNGLTKSASKTVTAPTGETDAYEWTETTASGTHLNNGPTITISSGSSYSISAFFKQVSGSGRGFLLQWYKSGGQTVKVSYVPSTDTTYISNSGGASAPTNVSVVTYPNGWYKISFTAALAETSALSIVGSTDGSGNASYTGSTSNSFSFWGLQYEQASFPTSYIPTSGATKTRTKDRAVIEGTNFTDIFDTNFESFSMFVNYDNLGITTGTNHAVVIFWGESVGYNDRIEFYKDDAAPYHIETRAFGGGSGVFSNGNLSAGSTAATQKLAMSWSVPDYSDQPSRRWAFSFNGESVDVVNDGSGSTIPAVTRVGFGINPTRTDFHGKRITFKQITLYSNALTDSQLQNLTK